MKKYNFEEVISALRSNQKIIFIAHHLSLFDDFTTYTIRNVHDVFTLFKKGMEVPLAPDLLEKMVYSSNVYFTKKIAHNEKLIEKWSNVEEWTPIEIRDPLNDILLLYFIEFDKETFSIKTSFYKKDEGLWRSTNNGIRLLGDEEFDIFER